MPPLSFFRKAILGGCLLSRSPKPSNSCSISFLCCNGLRTSRTMNIRLHVRATAITCRPLPLPSLAPSIIPGKSNNYKTNQMNLLIPASLFAINLNFRSFVLNTSWYSSKRCKLICSDFRIDTSQCTQKS